MRIRVSMLLIAVLVVFIIGGCSKPSPDGAIHEFLEYLVIGSYSEMYQMLTEEAQTRISEEEFVNKYQDIYQKIGKLRLELEPEAPPEGEKWPIKDNRVEVSIKGGMLTWTVDEISMDQTLKLVYEGKAWKIDWQPMNILPQLSDLTHQVEVSRTPAERGNIYDRAGKQLAGPGIIYEIGLVPEKMDNWEKTIKQLAELLNLSPNRIELALQQKWVRPDQFVPLRFITEEEWLLKKDYFMAIPGMLASSSQGRIYSTPESLAPTLGYLGEINQTELENWKTEGYIIGDLVGRTGIEAREEKYLAGKPGYMIRILDNTGKEQAMVKFARPLTGGDIFLTIDGVLHQIIDQAMGDRKGVVIALVPQTGEILALGSYPGFDPNDFVLGSSSTKINKLLHDPANPLINRPIRGRYIPGSTFKPITVLAALEFFPDYDPWEKVSLPDDSWRGEPGWGSYRIKRITRPEGPVDLFSAMKWSDNIYFAQLAYQMGDTPFFTMGQRLGFEENIPFLLDVEKSQLTTKGMIPNSILLADTGYGQGQVLMTPLHLAMVYSAIATDGKIRQPVLLTIEDREVVWKNSIATEEHLNIVRNALITSIQDPTALANIAAIPGLEMAGKTGTAQVNNEHEMGWFICYTPIMNPEFLLLVGIEDVADGSKEAIQVAREILMKYYHLEDKTD